MTLSEICKRLKCFPNRHRFIIYKKLSESSDKLYCNKCKRYFAINYDVRVILPWDISFYKFYEEWDEIIKRMEIME